MTTNGLGAANKQLEEAQRKEENKNQDEDSGEPSDREEKQEEGGRVKVKVASNDGNTHGLHIGRLVNVLGCTLSPTIQHLLFGGLCG